MPSTSALDASPLPRACSARVGGTVRMRLDDARVLPAFLFGHMTREAFVQRHRRGPGSPPRRDRRRVLHDAYGGHEGHRLRTCRGTLAGERPQRA